MGVPLLLTWLRKSFAKCFYPAEGEMSQVIRGSADNLYIDLNSLLYQSSQIISVGRGHFRTVEEVEDAVLRKLYELLDDIIFHLLEPKALVYIAVDGISPLGKMSQQRSRRQRQSERRTSHHPGHGSHHGGYGRRYDTDDTRDGSGVLKESMDALWDNNCITVGTRFMTKVTEALHAYAVSRTEKMNVKRFQEATRRIERQQQQQQQQQQAHGEDEEDAEDGEDVGVFTPLAIVIDDVLRPGEGEIKILEAIRRFREQPSYSPNLTHVICSSDTDVTVSSLLLHEPRMFVLRYEPPAALGGKDPALAAARAGPSPPGAVDSWLSTFFSIYMFREGLRKLLGLAPIEIKIPSETSGGGKGGRHRRERKQAFPEAPKITPEASAAFERALHDVVFVMLLFGNDFLPTLGGSIKEGTLDALLSLLASDFVSRGRTVVDPQTNHIHFTSARYLLECLSDIRGNTHGSSGLTIHIGDDSGRHRHRGNHGNGNHHNNSHHKGHGGHHGSGNQSHPNSLPTATTSSGSIGTDWGFADDTEFQQRQQEREKRLERKCYCYWTMLQWALQYSAGVVDHWGCYYPFPDAPPLHALKMYCGLLSYDALVKFVASRHAARQAGMDAEDLDLPDTPANAVPTGPEQAEARRLASRPTDAMVQLLVLTPRSSSALLPTVFRNAYDEIAEAVLAPVEKLDIGLVERWCDEKKKLLSEEERTRFDAYQLFSSPDPLLPPHERTSPAAAAAAVAAAQKDPSAVGMRRRALPACEATFMAYWDAGLLSRELDDYARRYREEQRKQQLLLEEKEQQQQQLSQAPAPAPATVVAAGRAAASFFGARKSKGPGAAAAALLQAKVAPPPPPPPAPVEPSPSADPSPSPADEAAASKDAEGTAATETAVEKPEAPVTEPAPREGGSPVSVSAAISAALVLVSNPVQSIFFFAGLPRAYLPSETLVQAMGYLDGPRFVIGGGGNGGGGAASAGSSASGVSGGAGGAVGAGGLGTNKYNVAGPPLSRDGMEHRVRLQWRVAVAAPALTRVEPTAIIDGVVVTSLADEDFVDGPVLNAYALGARTGLLRGCVSPAVAMTLSVKEMIAVKRAVDEAGSAGEDPWKAIEAKRQRREAA